MAVFSLREAAQQAGKSKSTIFRAIKAGRLSAARTDDGGFAIDAAELFRVYPPLSADVAAEHCAQQREGQDAPAAKQDAIPVEIAVRIAELETEVRMLRELLAEVKASRDELRSERDDWRSRAERRLTDQRLPPIPRAPAAPPRPASKPPAPKPVAADRDEETAAGATPSEQVDEAQAITGGSAVRPPAAPPVQDEIAAGMAAIKRRLELQMARRKLEELGDYDS